MSTTIISNLKIRTLAALLFGGCLCLGAAPVRATVLSIGFEQPTYSVGTLANSPAFSGQGGWSSQFDGLAQVSNTLGQVLDGAQSLVDAGDGTVKFYNEQQAGTASAGMNWTNGGSISALVQIADQSVAANTQEFGLEFQGNPSALPNPSITGSGVAYITISGGILSGDNNNGSTQLATGLVSSHVYSLTETFNFTNNTYTISWRDVTANGLLNTSSALAFDPPGNLAKVDAGGQVGILSLGPGTAIWDNIVLNDGQVVVPEPSTYALLVLGSLGLVVSRRFGKKARVR